MERPISFVRFYMREERKNIYFLSDDKFGFFLNLKAIRISTKSGSFKTLKSFWEQIWWQYASQRSITFQPVDYQLEV